MDIVATFVTCIVATFVTCIDAGCCCQQQLPNFCVALLGSHRQGYPASVSACFKQGAPCFCTGFCLQQLFDYFCMACPHSALQDRALLRIDIGSLSKKLCHHLGITFFRSSCQLCSRCFL